MLSAHPGFEVVGEASDGDEAITQTLELEPDILLLDVQMPRLPGLEAMRAIMNGTPTVKIILLTSTITTQQIIEALQIGARGIVLKDALSDHLQTSIRTVVAGDYWIGGKARRQPGDGAPYADAAGGCSAAEDLRVDATRARGRRVHCRGMQQPGYRQAVHAQRGNG